ncbi:hypothetical protein SK3146_01084 [Paenibacillus konkukensis]|uniref:DUF4825 domain-containing protein n=1 Tax=Paenibacillus konkukensis TaxID=2020716 RepID=A0ABY4RK42_9BACL|nr:hypothetical protein [Paenibacillus konkukensis]UQZ81928.1 hypothetical protein SK3146_01084 [Paenibacillus konkukensis]
MKWFSRLLITIVLSVGLVLGLSILPELESKWNIPAFHTVKAQPVSDNNIVDVMSKVQLHLRISHVELTHAIVSVDLFASPSSEKAEIIQDMYELSRYFFSGTTNINQVLIRVLDGSKEGGTSLLLATDARREKWLPGEITPRTQSAEEMEQYLQSHFRVTYTAKWQQRFDAKS